MDGLTGRGGRIGRAQASLAEGWKIESCPCQAIDLQNLHLLLSSLALGIARIVQGLVNSVSG